MKLLTEKKMKDTKLLSLVLRHKPEEIGLTLDSNGWADVNDLIKRINLNTKYKVTLDELTQLVADNDKQRFTFNDNKTKIRANQGHSIPIELGLEPTEPPDNLYHGTSTRNIDSILSNGISKQQRQHVHLSTKLDTAINVGTRHGTPAVLVIDSKQMYNDGISFVLSKNGVWLTDIVPPKYIVNIIYNNPETQ